MAGAWRIWSLESSYAASLEVSLALRERNNLETESFFAFGKALFLEE